MNVRRAQPRGYTIVEVMIFLAVSGGLFTIAAVLFSGQQTRTEFAQAARDVELQIQDVINDVSTGYYAKNADFKCEAPSPGGAPVPSLASGPTDARGRSKDCIFIGRVMHFKVAGSTDPEPFNLYTVVGRREFITGSGSKREVTKFDEAKPTMVDLPAGIDQKALSYGLKVKKMSYVKSGSSADIGAVGFFSGFGKYDTGTGNLLSGNQAVNMVPIGGTGLNTAPASVKTQVSAITDTSAVVDPDGGVIICFESGGTNQFAVVTIGSNGRQLTTKLDIKKIAPGIGECGT